MLLSQLAEKELIEVNDGVRYGFLANTECVLDLQTGKVKGFEIQPSRIKSMMSKHERQPFTILWENIVLIGEDRVLFRKTRE